MKTSFILNFIIALVIATPSPAAEPLKGPPAAESKAQAELRVLVARQKELLAVVDQATEASAIEDLRPPFQKLVNDYEQYLKDYPTVAAGYTSYAVLLGKPVLGERKRAAALLLRANELDPDQPLVKNQLGNYLAEEGRPLEASNYYLAAIKLAPDEPLYHYQLGTLLAEAHDDFLKSGQWQRPALDDAMHEAFRQATVLAPGNVGFAYRYGVSFYDLEKPDWTGALKYWRALEEQLSGKVEKQTIRLHEANVLLKQDKAAEARALLATVDEPVLQNQKQKLTSQLPTKEGPAGAASPTITFPVPAGQ